MILDLVAAAIVLFMALCFFAWFVLQAVETVMKIMSPDPAKRRDGWRELLFFLGAIAVLAFIEWRL